MGKTASKAHEARLQFYRNKGMIHARATDGRFNRLRWAMVWLTQVIFYGAVWLGSRGFSFLLMGEQMNATNHFGTAFGLGMSSLRVDHNAMAATDTDGVGTVLVPIPDSLDYKQNRYVMNSIDAASEFRFRGNSNKNHKHFKFSLGFRAGYVIQSHLKYKDEDVKYKLYSIEDIQCWRYGVTGRIGLGHLALDAYYSLAPLYKEGKGPADMMPYSIGIAWTF